MPWYGRETSWAPAVQRRRRRGWRARRRRCGLRHSPAPGIVLAQCAQHGSQGQFRVTRLEPLLQCGRDQPLSVGATHLLAEEIRGAPKVLDGREGDRVDSVVDRNWAGGRKPGDPVSERADE